jgi:hypothetical protein
MYQWDMRIVEESVMILDTLTRKKRPKKLLQQEPKAKKIFKELILNEVKGIKELIELKKKLNKTLSLNDMKKFFKEGDTIQAQIKNFVEKYKLGKKMDGDNAKYIKERILRSNLKNKTLFGFLHIKKAKKVEKKDKNDIFNLYKQDPNMLVIEFNRNKNLKIEKKPSIENLLQSNLKILKIIY